MNPPPAAILERWLLGFGRQSLFINVQLTLKEDFSSTSTILRFISAVAAILSIYLFLGPPSYVEVGIINEALYLFIIPLILIPTTIAISLLIGILLRKIPIFFNWWYNRPYVALLCIVLGVFLCKLSTNPQFGELHLIKDDAGSRMELIPNVGLLCTGGFIISFSLLHFYLHSFILFVTGKLGFGKKESV